jgi:taurine--2-oxoglutarate transaminase
MSETFTCEPAVGATWDEIRDWDERYYLRPFRAEDEYHHIAVDHGEGSYLVLADGRRVLDFLGQYCCVSMGQSHPRIRAAITEAAHRFSHLSEPWTSDYRAKAAKLIVDDLLDADDWAGGIRFVSTGSEAVEMAIVMAKLYTGRPNIVTQQFSYHGWTQGAAATTGLHGWRGGLASANGEVIPVPGYPPPEYHEAPPPTHWPNDGGETADGQLPCVAATERLIRDLGPETVAAFVCDVSLGPGIHPPPGYIPQIREMTRRLGVLWIDDEVLTGFGRMGTWFGYQGYQDCAPDLMALGKGLVGAAVPCAAVVARRDIAAFFRMWRWWLPSTMAAHPVAMAALVATIEAMQDEGVVENAARLGAYLGPRLAALEDQHRCVGHVNGAGLFWLIELVRDAETGERFVPEDRLDMGAGDLSRWPVNMVSEHCLEQGVFVGGFAPNTLRIAPALNVTEAECDVFLEALDYALDRVDERCDRS